MLSSYAIHQYLTIHSAFMLLHLPDLCSAKGVTLPLPYAACTCAVDPLAGLLCKLLGAGADAAFLSSPSSPESSCISPTSCPASSSLYWQVYWGVYSGVSGDQMACEFGSLGGLDGAAEVVGTGSGGAGLHISKQYETTKNSPESGRTNTIILACDVAPPLPSRMHVT